MIVQAGFFHRKNERNRHFESGSEHKRTDRKFCGHPQEVYFLYLVAFQETVSMHTYKFLAAQCFTYLVNMGDIVFDHDYIYISFTCYTGEILLYLLMFTIKHYDIDFCTQSLK